MTRIATIIPAYNAAATIGATLQSICAQTRPSDDIIVVDDGSRDNTAQIVRSFKHVRYLPQQNAGVSAARNLGATSTDCEWIAFCDSDDLWHSRKLEVIHRCIDQQPENRFYFHNFYLFDQNGASALNGAADTADSIFPVFRENRFTLKAALQGQVGSRVTLDGNTGWRTAPIYKGRALPALILGNFVLPSSAVIAQDFFLTHGKFDPAFRSAEETEFFLRLAKLTDFAFVDLPLAGYRKAPGGLTGNVPVLTVNALDALVKNLVDDPDAFQRFRPYIDLSFGRRYLRLAYYWLTLIKPRPARKNALRSLRLIPGEPKAWGVLCASLMPAMVLRLLRGAKSRFRLGL